MAIVVLENHSNQVHVPRQVSLTLLGELASYLKQARKRPGLAFEPSQT